jgi:NAD(P)-dependent dehydrogenase (short-subunit alcohol dehydrogenase family)
MSNSIGNLKGRTCVITGATSGIGRATAMALSAMGANLILAARRDEIGGRLAAQLSEQPGAGRIEFLQADLSEQRQVRALATAIRARHNQIDVLINNAGARFNTFHQSADGIELTFATNHLGHFLLTALLLEPLLSAKSARIITVGSGAHTGYPADGEWCLREENYDRKAAYGKSKLANIVFSYELARRLCETGAVCNAVDPGGVATHLGRNNGLLSWCRHLAYYALKRQLITPARGAETLVHLASASSLNGVTGKYFHEKREVHSSAASRDRAAAERLWSLSLELVHLEGVGCPSLFAAAAALTR